MFSGRRNTSTGPRADLPAGAGRCPTPARRRRPPFPARRWRARRTRRRSPSPGTEVEVLGCADLVDAPGIHRRDPVRDGERPSWSWVTKTVVMPRRSWMRRISSRSCTRTFASSAESGSSRRRTRGVRDERAGERDPLLLPAGELVREAVGEVAESTSSRASGRPARGLGLAHAAPTQAESGVLQRAQVREEGVRLEDHPDVPLVRRNIGHVPPAEQDCAACGVLEPGEHAQRGRLAAAGRSEQGDELAGRDVDVQPVQDAGRAVVLHDAAEFDARAGSRLGEQEVVARAGERAGVGHDGVLPVRPCPARPMMREAGKRTAARAA